ncbi:MAG: DUF512 domain-containing protein [Chloroflexota bacterium]|jgi:putative radical SAM enzyme (TIGR03279 family)
MKTGRWDKHYYGDSPRRTIQNTTSGRVHDTIHNVASGLVPDDVPRRAQGPTPQRASSDEPCPAGGVVASVVPGSIADECGMRPGDILLSINDHQLRDVIDYQFYSASPELTLVYARGSEEHLIEVEKDCDEGLGVEFQQPLFDGIRRCRNRCTFCFVKNLPPRLRPSLYIRDDDYRLSFLFGNFITLTNVTEDDLDRIDQQRLSPLFVSVHATDRQLRNRLLGFDAPDILEQIDEIGRRRVGIHAQVVLCPGINDGAALENTIEKLAIRHSTVRSVAVVPVGLTRYCRSPELRPFHISEAKRVVDQVSNMRRRLRKELGRSFVHLSDEFYVMTGTSTPAAYLYDGYPQLENGVGMVRRLLTRWASIKRRLPLALQQPRLVGWICGTSAYPTLSALAADVNRIAGLRVEVHSVANQFFGTTVTVSGLLTGVDVLSTLKDKRVDQWVLPRAMFDDTGKMTLDGMSLDEIRERALDPVTVAGSPKELIQVTLFGE